jgi:anaerobic selenocysteine-containing dehydrogenase
VNLLTGNLDRPGGAMFATPAVPFDYGDTTRELGALPYARWRSTVRGLPEFCGDLPAVTMAEDVETDAPERMRALVTHAGNPVLSNPDGARLARALDRLDFMVAVDIYANETTRHADLILPPTWSLERDNVDFFFYLWSTRNVAKYSPAALARPEGALHGWEIFLELAARLIGMGATPRAADDAFFDGLAAALGLEPAAVRPAFGDTSGPDRMIDLLLRVGPHGDGLGTRPDGWTLDRLRAEPHGVDFGPLRESLPGHLTTPSGRIELDHAVVVGDVPRLRAMLERREDGLLMIGRRDLRSKNSWLHNVPAMMKGADRCTLLVHPDDADRLGLVDGGKASLRTKTGALVAPVEVSDEMMRGVVSLPHGWGHALEGVELRVAATKPGVPTNFLLDLGRVDAPSGNAVLTAIPVEIAPAA